MEETKVHVHVHVQRFLHDIKLKQVPMVVADVLGQKGPSNDITQLRMSSKNTRTIEIRKLSKYGGTWSNLPHIFQNRPNS